MIANSFQETLLGLEFTQGDDRRPDLFSQACVEQYRAADFHRHGYLFAQVFEPNVLVEVAMLAGVAYEEVADLTHRPTPTMARLAELAAGAVDLSAIELINVAAALISVSRFDAATRLLDLAMERSGRTLETFEAWMLRFVVANRCDDGDGTRQAFEHMRAAIETGAIPPDRVVDASAQAVVWYMKRKALNEADYQWYLATGQALVDTGAGVDPGSISAWYRAVAMVPAAQGDADRTRQYMLRAREAAAETIALRPRAYERHFEKTYLESSLKEHMYVTRDFDRAEEAGLALIALDPVWSPSYAELGDAYLFFGKPKQAAARYRQAVEQGPPYYGYHLQQAAGAASKAGLKEQALDHYLALSDLVPDNPSVLTAGLDLARSVSHPARTHFERLLERTHI